MSSYLLSIRNPFHSITASIKRLWAMVGGLADKPNRMILRRGGSRLGGLPARGALARTKSIILGLATKVSETTTRFELSVRIFRIAMSSKSSTLTSVSEHANEIEDSV